MCTNKFFWQLAIVRWDYLYEWSKCICVFVYTDYQQPIAWPDNCRGPFANRESFYTLIDDLNDDKFACALTAINEIYSYLDDIRIKLKDYYIIVGRTREDEARVEGVLIRNNINHPYFIPHVIEANISEIINES